MHLAGRPLAIVGHVREHEAPSALEEPLDDRALVHAAVVGEGVRAHPRHLVAREGAHVHVTGISEEVTPVPVQLPVLNGTAVAVAAGVGHKGGACSGPARVGAAPLDAVAARQREGPRRRSGRALHLAAEALAGAHLGDDVAVRHAVAEVGGGLDVLRLQEPFAGRAVLPPPALVHGAGQGDHAAAVLLVRDPLPFVEVGVRVPVEAVAAPSVLLFAADGAAVLVRRSVLDGGALEPLHVLFEHSGRNDVADVILQVLEHREGQGRRELLARANLRVRRSVGDNDGTLVHILVIAGIISCSTDGVVVGDLASRSCLGAGRVVGFAALGPCQALPLDFRAALLECPALLHDLGVFGGRSRRFLRRHALSVHREALDAQYLHALLLELRVLRRDHCSALLLELLVESVWLLLLLLLLLCLRLPPAGAAGAVLGCGAFERRPARGGGVWRRGGLSEGTTFSG